MGPAFVLPYPAPVEYPTHHHPLTHPPNAATQTSQIADGDGRPGHAVVTPFRPRDPTRSDDQQLAEALMELSRLNSSADGAAAAAAAGTVSPFGTVTSPPLSESDYDFDAMGIPELEALAVRQYNKKNIPELQRLHDEFVAEFRREEEARRHQE
ncbi:hypothetical protein HDU98_003569 [Podochytrium sp. JEL0797]|nr:hypothetical protein HDU98_003569 [Podochytrium sp. JEL0797]